jgi:hypothetical protein
MLRSNPSAVVGDGNMSSAIMHRTAFHHVFVPKA